MLDHITRFVNHCRRRNPHARTWRDYQYDLTQFAALIGERDPATITIQDIDAFVIHQAERGLQPATINRRLAALTSFFVYLSDEDPYIVCPVLPHRHKLRQRMRLPRPVAQREVERFFEAIESDGGDNLVRDRAMFLLMLRCGLRIAEVASLTLGQLFLHESPPRLVVAGKWSKERSAYLSPHTEAALKAWLDQRPVVACDAVFLSYQLAGLSTTAIHKRLMRYRDSADITLTAHQLRHTFANDLVSADVPVTTIQKLLGHRWLDTTQTYIAANDKQVQRHFYAAITALEGWQ